MQINRLFEIVYILLDKKSITSRELSAQLGVSRRTICRDIDILSTAGIPIYTERGKGGGISLLPDFVLNKSILSEREQNQILSALYGLTNIMCDDTNQILEKLSTIFSITVTNWLEIDFSGWTHENDYFNEFKVAISERRIIEFEYYNRCGDKTFRRVEPMQLWFKSKAWYLKGFCLARQDIRLYKLPCIKNLILTDEVYTLRKFLNVSGNPISSIFEGQKIATIKLRIEPERAYRVYEDFYENMVKKQCDGSFIVTVSWPEDNWLSGFILSFGKYIEVLEPERLRKKIKEEAQNIVEKYL